MKVNLLLCLLMLSIATQAQANLMDDINPFDPMTEQALPYLDLIYEKESGKDAHLSTWAGSTRSCKKETCPVFVQVDKKTQTFNLMVEGETVASWPTSTGAVGYETPNFDRNPNGRIYEAYMSRTYPGKDYNGLGNMPYAVFIEGGFAIHGTESIHKLGRAVSHGCIRLDPENARVFNSLVRKYGIRKVWITVQ